MFTKKTLTYFFAVLLAAWTILPIYWVVQMSLSYNIELLISPTHLYPHTPTISNYTRIWGGSAPGLDGVPLKPVGQGPLVTRGLANSLLIALVTTLLTMILGMPAAYALGRLKFRFKGSLLFSIIFGRSAPTISILLPFYALYRYANLLATYRGLIIIYLTATLPISIWIMAGFFSALPRNLESAARVDGNTRFQAFWRVVCRVGAPGLAATGAICFMTAWNEFVFAWLLTTGSDVMTVPPALTSMFFQISWPNEMAAAVVMTMIPPMVLAFLFQRQIRDVNLVDYL